MSHSNQHLAGRRPYHALLPVLALILLALAILSQSAPVKADDRGGLATDGPAQLAAELDAIRQQATAAGSYRFTADVEQTLRPRAVPAMIGQSSQRVDMRLDGEMQLPDQLSLQMRSEGGTQFVPTIQLLQSGSESFVEVNGEWRPVENPLGAVSPLSDYLGYLAVAENVVEIESVTVAGETIRRFQFAIDARGLMEQMRLQAQRAQGAAGQVVAPGYLSGLSGQGELWVDAQNLPVRQILDIVIPGVTAEFDSASHTVVDFFDYGDVAAIAVPQYDSQAQAWVVPAGSSPAPATAGFFATVAHRLQEQAPFLLMGLFSIVAMLTMVRWYRRESRRTHVFVSLVLLVVLLSAPLMSAAGYNQATAYAAAAPPNLNDLLGNVSTAGEVAAAAQIGGINAPSNPFAAPNAACGDGTAGLDSDNDGLPDQAEYCLGTDPFVADSDGDSIPDGVEVAGFSFANSQWYSNPLSGDSNQDGLLDTLEWPVSAGGQAPEWDIDRDGVPNLWDDDNDNDKVPDKIDLDPFAYTEFVQDFEFSLTGNDGNGYAYVDLQIRPLDQEHLRYTTTPLDWPDADGVGPMQDLDNSKEDLRLVPMLLIKTNAAPDSELARNYGVSLSPRLDNLAYPYEMLAPLSPIGDGGQIVGFQTRIAYDLAGLPDLHWQAELVWMVQAQVDSLSQNGGTVVSDQVPFAQYANEFFQLTGLQITRSQGYESAIFAVSPDQGNNSGNTDQETFQLLFALNAGFLNTIEPEAENGRTNEATPLQEIQYRFDRINLDPVVRWGFDSSTSIATDYQVYGHRDEALADRAFGSTAAFLDTNFPQTNAASLAVAYQETAGAFTLDDFSSQSGGATNAVKDIDQLAVNLASDFVMVTRRGVNLETFVRDGLAWRSQAFSEMMRSASDRYLDVSTTLTDFSAAPELTDTDVRGVMLMHYASWYQDHVTVTHLDDQQTLTTVVSNQEIYDTLSGGGSLPTYLLAVGDLVQPGAGLKISADSSQNWDYRRAQQDTIETFSGFAVELSQALEKSFFDSEAFNTLRSFQMAGSVIFRTKQVGEIFIRASINVAFAKFFGQSTSFWKFMTPATTQKLGLAGLAVSVVAIWTIFALTDNLNDPRVLKSALTQAIVATAFVVALFVLSLNPVGALVSLVLGIIDFIFFLVTGDSLMDEAIKATTDFFYKYDMVSELAAVRFEGAASDMIPAENAPGSGFVVGSSMVITDHFVGNISGGLSARYASSVYARYIGESAAATVVDTNDIGGEPFLSGTNAFGDTVTFINPDNFVTDCQDERIGNKWQHECENNVGTTYRFDEAAPNIALTLYAEIFTKLRYEECSVGICDTKTQFDRIRVPGKKANDETIYMDILPARLNELWTWSLSSGDFSGHQFNLDWDGDGLTNVYELNNSLYATDFDSDDDGLTDGFEVNVYGTDPLLADSDNDALSDGREFELGTDPLVADSDGDGLNDGAEVAGWEIILPGGILTRVYADPLVADADGDGLSDLAERNNGSSPFAVNNAPLLILNSPTLRAGPGAAPGVYVQPGETVALDLVLYSSGISAVDAVLTLCLPASLSNVTGGQLSGDRTPALQQGNCANNGAQYQWDFAATADQLRFGEVISTSFTANISNALTQSEVITVSATLPYLGLSGVEETVQTVSIFVDIDDPAVSFTAPVNGEVIGGGVTDYVIGGTAFDATSWVTGVDIALPGGSAAATLGTDSDLGQWAAVWQLPADGVYQIQAQAVDAVNRTSGAESVTVTVDNTPPVVTLTAPGSALTSSFTDTIEIPLSGTVADATSGVQRVQLSINDRPWREVDLNGGSWQFNWTLPNETSAQGDHTVRVRAFDVANNVSAVVSQDVLVDVIPPTAGLTDNTLRVTFVSQPANAPFSIEGVANDAGNVPLPANGVPLAGTLHSLSDATIWLQPDALVDGGGGMTVRWLGDINGDRLADMAVGLPAAAGGDGTVTIVYGRAGGWITPPDAEALASSNSSFVGATGAAIGTEIIAPGDVNGDSLDDLIIGDLANNSAYLILGRSGPYGKGLALPAYCPGCTAYTVAAGYNLTGMSSAGDINGDGFNDIFATTNLNGQYQAHLLLGTAKPAAEINAIGQAAWTTNLAGSSALIQGIGDRDGDQRDDFVAQLAAGDLTLHYGNAALAAAGSSSAPALATDVINGAAAHIAALEDVDGDNLADFAFGGGTAVTIIYGAGDRSTNNTATIGVGSLTFLVGVGDVHTVNSSNPGLADLIVGDGPDALLYSDNSWGLPTATLTGVVAVADAPFTAGADLNADGSADLLLVPNAASGAGLGFGQPPAINQGALPTSAGTTGTTGIGVNTFAAGLLTAADRHVDDDGACAGLSPCYSTIQAAIDAAAAGDTIAVHPGVYGSFTVAGRNNLTISGVNADAVFVDGNGGEFVAAMNQVTGVSLTNMTIRNASVGVRLTAAGEGGYINTNDRIVLTRLLFQDFTTHAVQMDRLSNATVEQSTIVGSSSDPYINVSGTVDPGFLPSWESATPAVSALFTGGRFIEDASSQRILAVRGGGSTNITGVTPGTNVSSLFSAPVPVDSGTGIAVDKASNLWFLSDDDASPNGPVYAVEYVNDNLIFVAGDFTQVGSLVLEPANIAMWNGREWRSLGLSANGREPVGRVIHELASDAAGNLYVGTDACNSQGFCSGGSSIKVYGASGGNIWHDLVDFNNPGYQGRIIFDTVYALAFNADGSRLYIGGELGKVEGIDADFNGIAYWDVSNKEFRKVDGRFTDTTLEIRNAGQDVVEDNAWRFQEGGGGVWSLAPEGTANCTHLTVPTANIFYMSRDCRLPGVVYDIEINGSQIWIGGQFSHVGGGGTVSLDNISAYGLAVYYENSGSLNNLGECQDGTCWFTTYRTSYTTRQAQYNPMARGVGEAAAYRTSTGAFLDRLADGTNSQIVRSLEVRTECSTICYPVVFIAGDFTIYDWDATVGDKNNRVDESVGSSELINPVTNIAQVDGYTLWSSLPTTLGAGAIHRIDRDPAGGNIIVAGAFPGGVARLVGNSWNKPAGMAAGGVVYDLAFNDNRFISMMYAGGNFNLTAAGVTTRGIGAWQPNRWLRRFDYRLTRTDAAGGTVTPVIAPTEFGNLGPGTLLIAPGASSSSSNLYAVGGGSNKWMVRSSFDYWVSLGTVPETVGTGAAAVWIGDDIYLFTGAGRTSFYRYNTINNSWTTLDRAPTGIGAGASLAWDGGDYIYALAGGAGNQLYRYSISGDIWTTLTGLTPVAVNGGGGLVHIGQTLYMAPGGGVSGHYQYALQPQTPPVKLRLNDVVFAAAAGGAATWIQTPGASLPDFAFTSASSNRWVTNGSFAPTTTVATQNVASAGFLDSAQGLYRQTAATPFTAGYHTFVPEATVATDACGGSCYGSIQNAIYGGANRVLLMPGSYEETVNLVSGVAVVGSGAEATEITVPAGINTGSLITAEGVAQASLSGVSLNGDDILQGLHVEDGANGLTLQRNIIRNNVIGLSIADGNSSLSVINSNIVNNGDGVLATACNAFDLRNSVVAFNSNGGVSYGQSCTGSHTYNLYWENGVDLDDSGNSGSDELFFVNPLFVNAEANNYRVLSGSPLINGGAPGDPTPGTGRIDIGYIEQAQAGFYVDANYCATCQNDGLTWGVNAFDAIQPALDAAAARIRILAAALEEPQYTVAVAPGIYPESITMPSYVRLVGSGAESTIIEAQTGSAVYIGDVVDVQLTGFTIRNASGNGQANVLVSGAASDITISHNLIINAANGADGIRFMLRATGRATFNTFVNNDGSHINSVMYSWVSAHSNVLASGPIGLRTQSGGQIFHDYNLLFSTTNYQDDANTGLFQGANEIVGQDPLLSSDGLFRLLANSAAIDAADPDVAAPTGGGSRADMGYAEVLAIPVALFLGDAGPSAAIGNSGVDAVEIAVVQVADPTVPLTATLPTSSDWFAATVATQGATISTWQQSFTPNQDGLYRIYTRSTDLAANTEIDEQSWFAGSFVADSTAPVVAWDPVPGSGAAPFELRVVVTDTVATLHNVDEVYFVVNGTKVAATWLPTAADDSRDGRVYRAWVSAGNGTTALQAFAVDKAGNVGSSSSQTINVSSQRAADSTAPLVAITSPANDFLGQGTIAISGTVSDAGSGIATVEVSVDGGYRWLPARFANGAWQFTWLTPADQAGVTYVVRARAIDNAGNVNDRASRWIHVDDTPAEILGLTFGSDFGSYAFSSDNPMLNLSWDKVADGSGPAELYIVMDDQPDTVTFTSNDLVTAAAYSAALPTGASYVHLTTVDAAGNRLTTHYGPWYVDQITLDGYVDSGNSEWKPQSQLLDDDERSGSEQKLYARWDATNFYVAWSGAYWDVDGTLWAYVATDSGVGSTLTVDGARTLPFAADYAVQVSSPISGTLWQFDGSSWQAGTLTFAQGDSGSTEVQLPFGSGDTNTIALLAFAEDESGNVWSVFPTTNALVAGSSSAAGLPLLISQRLVAPQLQTSGGFTASGGGPLILSPFVAAPTLQVTGWQDAYFWDDLTNDVPNANQPQALTVDLAVSSPQSAVGAWGKNDQLAYNVQITNRENETLSGLTLTFAPDAALTFSGGSVIALPDLLPGESYVAAISGQLAADLTGRSETVTTIVLQQGSTTVQQTTYTHTLDSIAPTVTVVTDPGQVLGLGAQSIVGTASDGTGAGLARVEISLDGANWQTATGRSSWTAPINVTGGTTVDVYARAVDRRGNVSPATQITFTVDSVAPATTLVVPPLTTRAYAIITGVATDPAPAGAQIARVEIQIDSDTSPWRQVTGPYTVTGDGSQRWSFTWNAALEDSVTHQFRARVTDFAGNVSTPTAWQTTIVDNVRPAAALTAQLETFLLSDYLAGNVNINTSPILTGTLSDGGGIQSVSALVTDPLGDTFAAAGAFDSTSWSLTPVIGTPRVGVYSAVVTVTDAAGNATRIGPFTFEALNTPPVAVDDAFTTDEDTALVISDTLNLLVDNGQGPDYDLDGDPLTVAAVNGTAANVGTPVTLASGALITVTADGTFTFDPNARFETLGVGASAVVTFSYTVFDQIEPSLAPATTTITVAGVNDKPTIAVDQAAVTVDEGETAVNTGVMADIDAGDALTLYASIGAVVDDGNGGWRWSWATSDGPTESQTVVITVVDNHGGLAVTRFALTVNNVDPTVSIAGEPLSSSEGVQIDLTSTVVDPSPVDTFTYDWQVTKDGAPFAAGTDETFSWIPDDNGSYVVSLVVTDDDGGIGSDSVAIAVTNVAPILSLSPLTATVQYSDPSPTFTLTATDMSQDQLTALATLNGGGLGPLTIDATGCTPDADPLTTTCTWTVNGLADLAPGTYTITLTVSDEDGGQSSIAGTLTVVAEDARATYTGPTFAATTSARDGAATIELRATIRDISAVLNDAATDPFPGDIRNATVTFEVVGTGQTCAATSVDLIDPADITTGTATCEQTFDIGSADSESYEIRVLINGHYVGALSPEVTVVTISKPLDNFITGGGFLELTDSAGLYAGDDGSRLNFGFNVKFNKKGTNLQGRATLIVRADGHVYQIKTTNIQSLGVEPGPNGGPPSAAEFEAKANIIDITDPNNLISLGGNLTFQMRLTDNGEPGDADTISITVWDNNGLLLFSTSWDGAQSVEQLLAGGNLQVR